MAAVLNVHDPATWLKLGKHPVFARGSFDPAWYDGDADHDLTMLRLASLAMLKAHPEFACELVVLNDCTTFVRWRQEQTQICDLYPSRTDDGEPCYFVDIEGSNEEFRPVTIEEMIRTVETQGTSAGRIYSVNEVIDALVELHGQTIEIACTLLVEFEGDSIWHRPKSECRPDYGSSLWADFDFQSLGCDPNGLEQFNHRHVVVMATVDGESQGHFSLWPGSVVVRKIRKGA